MRTSLLAATALLLLPPTPALPQDYAAVSGDDRVSYVASKNQTGTTVPIPIADITRLCGDMDGCSVRMGMHDWDGSAGGRVASREFLFFYNPQNGNWRASLGDNAGSDNNGSVDHVNRSWTCFMTDGEANNMSVSDVRPGFGLLVWTEYRAGCWLTLID